jgi:dihydropteroate synthase
LAKKTFVMAILNMTPDSFSGDGFGDDVERAVAAARKAEADGADLLDIGGESTRPGHVPVPASQELVRVLPVIEALRGEMSIPISIDTSKSDVAAAALAAGATIVNDVRGLTRDPRLRKIVAEAEVPVVIMHDLPPESGQDLLFSIKSELQRRIEDAVAAGIRWEFVIIDPGFGFGKTWRQNLELLRRLSELRELGRPVLVGFSRKKTIGRILDGGEQAHLVGTLATTALAIANGADVVRVHDVLPNVQIARMTDAVVRRIPDLPPDPELDRPA